LKSSKELHGNGKRSYEETVQQEEAEPIRTKEKTQHVTGSQKYPFGLTLKEAKLEKIQIF